MHYYQHHIGDFIRDTSRLTDAQCMAYLRMIWMYYDTEKPLPDNPRIIAFKIGASEIDVQLIMEAFFELTDGLWHHSRCDEEIAGFMRFCDAQKSKGRRGGRPKKNPPETQEKPEQNPAGFRGVSDGNPVESPRNPNHIPNMFTTDVVNKERAPKFDAAKVDLPSCISNESWAEWVAYRRKRKLTTSEQTMLKQIDALAAWHSKGHDPTAIINASITNGWQGLFEPKPAGQQQRGSAYHESIVAAGKSIFGDISNARQQRTEREIIDVTPQKLV